MWKSNQNKLFTCDRKARRSFATLFALLFVLGYWHGGAVGTAQQLPPSTPKLPEFDTADRTDGDEASRGDWKADVVAGATPSLKIYIRRLAPRNGGQGTVNTLPLPDVDGLSPEIVNASRSKVQFRIEREAGTIQFEGVFDKGKGTGTWTLTPDPAYTAAMARRGYTNLKGTQLFFAVTENITEKYINDLRTAGFDDLSFIDLVEAAGNNVTLDFIQRVRSRGYPNATLKEMVQLRVHDIMR